MKHLSALVSEQERVCELNVSFVRCDLIFLSSLTFLERLAITYWPTITWRSKFWFWEVFFFLLVRPIFRHVVCVLWLGRTETYLVCFFLLPCHLDDISSLFCFSCLSHCCKSSETIASNLSLLQTGTNVLYTHTHTHKHFTYMDWTELRVWINWEFVRTESKGNLLLSWFIRVVWMKIQRLSEFIRVIWSELFELNFKSSTKFRVSFETSRASFIQLAYAQI